MSSGLLVLGDAAVHEILISLSKDEIYRVRDYLAKALEDFSTPEERQIAPDSVVVTRPHAKTLFRPFTSSENVGIKIIVDPSAGSEALETAKSSSGKGNNATLHGLLALCDKHGVPVGIINADEITAYRTSLSVMIPYVWRARTAHIVVFGAGKQALWHVRLTLALRGDEIAQIAIVNRSAERAESLVAQLQHENDAHWKSPAKVTCISPITPNYEQRLEGLLAEADIVFCTTPSAKPLFPARYLKVQLNSSTGSTGCYVSSVGSWQPDMIELDPQLLRDAVDSSRGKNPLGHGGGLVLVDDRNECLRSSGEVIGSQLQADDLIEAGEMLSWARSSSSSSSSSSFSTNKSPHEWLSHGFVVYKSIGVSSTDLAAGMAILALARERGSGVSVADF
ncbi:hypothetical protein Z517_03289 [Fonsecaea pedrosoi CBS 271.37]|uniref:Quinate/shikimate 5-dehydrogenase/glutamyl-tRNA reductase domain-containing protein n=1 Tax=Fonsecaea pedrosoi CBS 271.37 TaxID=1442368 RepID=A0A0D2GSU1_9EURO|nr:uncharacterized protein Z517_03289 [Fonsecaea pedrosoi CBS 271.37]KIW84043.1 hypothetical protein Z517_03289 [Fonsecaea pedrosoi CBS 271.37]